MIHSRGNYFLHFCSCLSVTILFLLVSLSCASAQIPTSSEPKAASPITMTELEEGTENPASWHLLGTQGDGEWQSGERATLTVQKAENDTVVIHRVDSSGPSAGLTATYTGTRRGDRIEGSFTSSWPGHWNSHVGTWSAAMEHLPVGLPADMRFCGPAHCATLKWTNGAYNAVYDDIKHIPGASSTFKVVVFKPEGILINRSEFDGSTTTTSELTGRMSEDKNSIVNGHITFTDKDGQLKTFNYQLTWGSAINSAQKPGQPQAPQQAQPVLVVRPALVCFPWFFGITCN